MGKICRKISSSDQLCSSSIISEFEVMFSRVFSVHFWPFFLFLSVLVVWWGPPIFDQEGDVTEEARVPRPCHFSCCSTTACQEGWGGSRVFSYALVLLGQNHVLFMSLYTTCSPCICTVGVSVQGGGKMTAGEAWYNLIPKGTVAKQRGIVCLL